jgi:hypothetical protein
MLPEKYEVLWGEQTLSKETAEEMQKDLFSDGLEAMNFARRQLGRGKRVIAILCPSGEVWREEGLREFFPGSKNSN